MVTPKQCFCLGSTTRGKSSAYLSYFSPPNLYICICINSLPNMTTFFCRQNLLLPYPMFSSECGIGKMCYILFRVTCAFRNKCVTVTKRNRCFTDWKRLLPFESRATWCLRGEDLRSNNDVIFFAAKKMTSSLLHKSSPRRHHVARL